MHRGKDAKFFTVRFANEINYASNLLCIQASEKNSICATTIKEVKK